jgi:hypothetical protein
MVMRAREVRQRRHRQALRARRRFLAFCVWASGPVRYVDFDDGRWDVSPRAQVGIDWGVNGRCVAIVMHPDGSGASYDMDDPLDPKRLASWPAIVSDGVDQPGLSGDR